MRAPGLTQRDRLAMPLHKGSNDSIVRSQGVKVEEEEHTHRSVDCKSSIEMSAWTHIVGISDPGMQDGQEDMVDQESNACILATHVARRHYNKKHKCRIRTCVSTPLFNTSEHPAGTHKLTLAGTWIQWRSPPLPTSVQCM